MRETLSKLIENKTSLDVSEFFGGENLEEKFETLTKNEI